MEPTKQEIESVRKECDIRVSTPGKFEGEKLYVPYFYDISLDSGGALENGIHIVEVEDVDKAFFPELEKDTIRLYEDDNGFVREVASHLG